ncbi:BTB/POZ domain-containing protein 9-like [Adelges cooleyi]|uniref:BTB/POZ domain-containing protein 9-like n=1 Tax=Adelges cooleyi TaxID=133065 RepID=UPI0021806D52|nr:BTB/POZ domain-containing protein 9-like [Adelges cooleyi]
MTFILFIAFVVLRSTPAFSDPSDIPSSSSNPPGYEQIDHSNLLANDNNNLYLDESSSDVVLVVDNEEFHAHREVLASSSEYFKSLLYGEHKEAREKRVLLEEVTATSFKVLLKYIYSGRMNLSNLEGKVILELVSLSNFYGFFNLKSSLSEYLLNNISVDNASSLFAVAHYYELKELEVISLNFIDMHALDVLQSEDSVALSSDMLQQILNRDTVYTNEIDMFRAVCRWIKKNPERLDADAITNILSAVRYQRMNDEELSEVKRSDLVISDTIILDIIKWRIESLTGALNYLGHLEPIMNFAEGTERFESHGGTMIKLNRPFFMNYIEMKVEDDYLSQPLSRACCSCCYPFVKPYSYYIEVSIDRLKWLRVIDHSNSHCHSIQRLWIPRQFVQYIRIVGTKNTDNKPFRFLKVMYNTDKMHLVEIKNGLVAPQFNVALTSMNATVIEGSPKFSSTLVSGDYEDYDSYSYHFLGSGCIKVQLAQPYVLSSMRMLLWDCDRRTYGYTVEVSVDNLVWDMVVDKSNGSAQSWQLFKFDPRPIVYIRITGIRSSKKDGIFRCVHLEAPAQISLDSNIAQKEQWSIFRFCRRKLAPLFSRRPTSM